MATASGTLFSSEVRACYRCIEVAKKVLQHGLQSLIAIADNLPCLRFSSADGTPIHVSRRSRLQQPDGSVKIAIGKETIEFLVANTWIRVRDSSGRLHTRVAFSDPQPLIYGKTAPAIVGALLGHWKTLRQRGHQGISIESYGMDRASFDAIQRLLFDHHETMHGAWNLAEPTDALAAGVDFACGVFVA